MASSEMTYADLVSALQTLNPNAEIKSALQGMTIQSSVPLKKLVLPTGFHLGKGNCITNEGNAMFYLSVTVEPLMEAMRVEAKKLSFLGKIKHKILRQDDKEM